MRYIYTAAAQPNPEPDTGSAHTPLCLLKLGKLKGSGPHQPSHAIPFTGPQSSGKVGRDEENDDDDDDDDDGDGDGDDADVRCVGEEEEGNLTGWVTSVGGVVVAVALLTVPVPAVFGTDDVRLLEGRAGGERKRRREEEEEGGDKSLKKKTV